MKHWLYYILFLLTAVVLVGCADDSEQLDQDPDAPMEMGISARWQCGRTKGTTRALVDVLGNLDASGNSTLYPKEAYPEWLHITVGDHDAWNATFGSDPAHPEKFAIKQTFSENDNYDTRKFIAYHAQYLLENYKKVIDGESAGAQRKPFYTKSQAQKLTWEARTFSPRTYPVTPPAWDLEIPQAWDESDYTTYNKYDFLTSGGQKINVVDQAFGGMYTIERNHLFFTLGHAYALVRLFFAVDEDYDKIRYIDLKNVTMDGLDIMHEDHYILPVANVGNTSGHGLYAYAYVKPSHQWDGNPFGDAPTGNKSRIGTSTNITVECTYDIYERDANFPYGVISDEAVITAQAEHRTRKDVTATNIFTFGKLKDGGGATVTKIRAGYYYDVYITINPDYLYVLSEHDNKHMVID